MAKRIYVAGPYADRAVAKSIAESLEQRGYAITQRWWLYEGSEEVKGAEFLQLCAELDKRGVRTADAVVLLNSQKSEGKAVEQGLAIAYGIPIVAIGQRGAHSANVFHYLPNYHWVNGTLTEDKRGFTYEIDDIVKKLEEVIGEPRAEFIPESLTAVYQ